MTIFKDLSAEDIAYQHHLVLDFLLHGISMGNPALQDQIAETLDHMGDECEQSGRDRTLIDSLRESIVRVRERED